MSTTPLSAAHLMMSFLTKSHGEIREKVEDVGFENELAAHMSDGSNLRPNSSKNEELETDTRFENLPQVEAFLARLGVHTDARKACMDLANRNGALSLKDLRNILGEANGSQKGFNAIGQVDGQSVREFVGSMRTPVEQDVLQGVLKTTRLAASYDLSGVRDLLSSVVANLAAHLPKESNADTRFEASVGVGDGETNGNSTAIAQSVKSLVQKIIPSFVALDESRDGGRSLFEELERKIRFEDFVQVDAVLARLGVPVDVRNAGLERANRYGFLSLEDFQGMLGKASTSEGVLGANGRVDGQSVADLLNGMRASVQPAVLQGVLGGMHLEEGYDSSGMRELLSSLVSRLSSQGPWVEGRSESPFVPVAPVEAPMVGREGGANGNPPSVARSWQPVSVLEQFVSSQAVDEAEQVGGRNPFSVIDQRGRVVVSDDSRGNGNQTADRVVLSHFTDSGGSSTLDHSGKGPGGQWTFSGEEKGDSKPLSPENQATFSSFTAGERGPSPQPLIQTAPPMAGAHTDNMERWRDHSSQVNRNLLKLDIQDEMLGKLVLEVKTKQNEVSARLMAETEQARSLILQNTGALRQEFQSQGLVLGQFQVDIQGQGKRHGEQGRERNVKVEKNDGSSKRKAREGSSQINRNRIDAHSDGISLIA